MKINPVWIRYRNQSKFKKGKIQGENGESCDKKDVKSGFTVKHEKDNPGNVAVKYNAAPAMTNQRNNPGK